MIEFKSEITVDCPLKEYKGVSITLLLLTVAVKRMIRQKTSEYRSAYADLAIKHKEIQDAEDGSTVEFEGKQVPKAMMFQLLTDKYEETMEQMEAVAPGILVKSVKGLAVDGIGITTFANVQDHAPLEFYNWLISEVADHMGLKTEEKENLSLLGTSPAPEDQATNDTSADLVVI